MDDLEFVMKMTDQLTGPASVMGKALAALQDQLHKTQQRANETSKSGGGSGGFGGLMTAMNQTVEVASKVVSALGAIGEVGLDVGKFVVSTAAYKQATTTALQSILHVTKGEAKEVFGEISKIANTTPFESADVANTIKKLIGSGFSKEQAFEAFKSIGDVSAFNNFDTSILDRLASSFGRIQSQGKLTGESLQMIVENSQGAISMGGLAKALGLKDVSELMPKVSNGSIKAAEAIAAIQKVVTEGVSGGKAGGLMASLGQEIPGLLSTLKDVPFSLIPSVDDSEGLKSFRAFLQRLVGVFDDSNPAFVRIKTAIGDLIDTIFGGFEGLGGDKLGAMMEVVATTIEKISTTLKGVHFAEILGKAADAAVTLGTALGAFGTGALEGLSKTLGPIMDGMKSAGANAESWAMMGKAIGFTVGALVRIGVALGDSFTWFYKLAAVIGDVIGKFLELTGLGVMLSNFWTEFADGMSFLYDSAVDAAGNFIKGLVDGITNGAVAVWDSVKALGSGIVDTVTGVLKINSPSVVGKDIGGYFGQGIALGAEGSVDDVQGAMAKLVDPSAIGAGASGIGSAGSTVNNEYVITINVAAGASVDGASLDAMKKGVKQAVVEAHGDS